MIQIKPQSGPQEQFLSTSADISIYGGAAGGGKTYALLLEPVRHLNRKGFGGVIFRRTSTQIRAEGGLWDESENIYIYANGAPKESVLKWDFPARTTIQFAGLEYEKDIYNWQGAQITYLGFDELTHFSKKMFFYMLSRNRSTCGIRPYVRATCNPDADSWLVCGVEGDSSSWGTGFISWWIGEDGYPIPERSGKIRWFIQYEDVLIWADTEQELLQKYPYERYKTIPKSVTFIPAKLEDNKILMQMDPGYEANLMAQTRVERERLRFGNWKIRFKAGEMFQREWFEIVNTVPPGLRRCRHWDLAATAVKDEEKEDPDWTVGLLLGELKGTFYVLDIARFRKKPAGVEETILQTAQMDGREVEISMEQEPGSSGVNTIDHYARVVLKGYTFHGIKTTGSKIERAKPASAAAENRNIKLLRAPWNAPFLSELEVFPSEGEHDDQVDGLSGAFERLANPKNNPIAIITAEEEKPAVSDELRELDPELFGD